MHTRFVFSMVRRELRAAGRRFGFYGSCMAIGIAVVVCLHSLREAVEDAVHLDALESGTDGGGGDDRVDAGSGATACENAESALCRGGHG